MHLGRMLHTFAVRLLRALALSAPIWSAALPAAALDWQRAADAAARDHPEVRIVVLDLATNRVLAAHRLGEAGRTLAAPGSTLKPLVLYALLSAGRWRPERRVACDRKLVIAGHRLACTHPALPAFDAHEALTWSCNTYFAAVARTLKPGELGPLLRPTGLLGATGLAADEAVAEFREPQTPDALQLAVLGVDGVRVTPLELAAAYSWLARELVAHVDTVAAQTVRAGLEDSASFGMAGAASLGGVSVAGKTGTAEGIATAKTHGWFVGLAPALKPKAVVVVYLPAGRGSDAARAAGELLANSPLGRP